MSSRFSFCVSTSASLLSSRINSIISILFVASVLLPYSASAEQAFLQSQDQTADLDLKASDFQNILVEALYYTNSARQQNGVQGLAPSQGLENSPYGQAWGPLQQAAFNHARDMAERNYMSHYTPEGWDPGMRLRGLNYSGIWGENIFCGSSSPGDAISWWMESPPHRANMLDGAFSRVGIAHYYNPESSCKHYWVMVLGR